MTASDSPTTDAPSPWTPVQRAPLSGTAMVSFIIAAATAFLYMTAKTIGPVLQAPNVFEKDGVAFTVLGWFGLASIVLIAGIIVLGHFGLVATKRGARGRWLATAGLVLGYLLLALYLNRIIVSVIALALYPDSTNFVQNNFIWV